MIVNHTKDSSHTIDIITNNVGLIVGGKNLLDDAYLKLSYG